MAAPFPFKEQDLTILQQLKGLESRDHLPDNFVIFDYDSFSKDVVTIDTFCACKFLSENFHVIIVTGCDMLKISFKHLDSENHTIIPAVPSRILRSVARPCDHLATLIMAHLTEHARSDDRKAYYCLSADKSFPVNTEMIDIIGDEFVYCCVIKTVGDFLSLERLFHKHDNDPVKMRLYRLLQNDVPRDDSDPEKGGKIMFFHHGDDYYRKVGPPPWPKIQVQTLWQELKVFADNYDPLPLHVSVTTAFPSKRKDSKVVREYPEVIKPKFYRFLIYLPDASEYEVLSVLKSLRTQYPIFKSTVWSRKFDKDTKEKKFGSLGHRDIPKGAVYKLGDRRVLQKDSSSANTNFQTRHFKDLYLDDDHIKQLLVEAKQQGATMKVRHAKILFCGASGAGKTSFCRLLKNTQLDKEWNSTGLADSQQIMISEKATINNNEWTELNPAEEINQLKLRLKHRKLTKVKTLQARATTDKYDDERQADNGDPYMASTSESQYKKYGQKKQVMRVSHFKTLPERIPEVEKCLVSNYYNADKQDTGSAELPKIWDILTLLDTGGQPQFINMLPAVNTSATITFVVLNMAAGEGSKILDERIQVHHYKNGKRSYEPYPLNYTNKDLIKCLVALLKDSIVRDIPLPVDVISKAATDHKPGLCFVGTHLDRVTGEAVDSIDKNLEKLVECLEPNDNIYILNLGKILFAVDNTMAGKDSSPDSIANKIRLTVKKLVEEKAVYEVPITWILLELEIRRRCGKQKRSFISIPEVLQLYNSIVPEYHGTVNIELEVKAALRFHHTFGVLLYFHDVPGMNDYVISDPQWLFANLTNVVCCSFDEAIVDHGDMKKLKSKGILSKKLIKEINIDSLGGIEISHFFQLLQYLKIVTPFPKSDSPDFLMLSILDSFKDDKGSVFYYLPPTLTTELLIQLKSGTLPRGIFCCLVVQLIQTKSEDWMLQPTLNDRRCIYENLVVFCLKHSGHYLVLFDKVTHLEVQLRPNSPENDDQMVYYEVQQCITSALRKVSSGMCDDMRYGLYCDNEKCLKPILTLSVEHMDGQKPLPPSLHCENHGFIKLSTLWCKASNKGVKEYEVFIDNYSNLTALLKPSFNSMIPHCIAERIICPEERSIKLEDFLEKIATCLKDGHTEHFNALLKIMKCSSGKSPYEELAVAMEKKLVI